MRTSEVGWVCPFCGSSELDNGDFIHNHFVCYNCIDIKLGEGGEAHLLNEVCSIRDDGGD